MGLLAYCAGLITDLIPRLLVLFKLFFLMAIFFSTDIFVILPHVEQLVLVSGLPLEGKFVVLAARSLPSIVD